MRIGIDFDNTIICYDRVFTNLAKSLQLVPENYQGTKQELRDKIRHQESDLTWQQMQGKVYGQLINEAELFHGFKDFIAACHVKTIDLFIVSHKTELGHFDEKRINLREAARQWLDAQGFFKPGIWNIPENHLYFETTQEDKIKRIQSLGCTHFIDDLVEVFDSPLFPKNVKCFLFQPPHSNWTVIKDVLFND